MATRTSFRGVTAGPHTTQSRVQEKLENSFTVDDVRPSDGEVTLTTRTSDVAGVFTKTNASTGFTPVIGSYIAVAWQVNGVWTYAYFGYVNNRVDSGFPLVLIGINDFVGAILPPVNTICRVGTMELHPFYTGLSVLQDKIRFCAGMKEDVGPVAVAVSSTPMDKTKALFLPVLGNQDAQFIESHEELTARNPSFISGDSLYTCNLSLSPARIQAISMNNSPLPTNFHSGVFPALSRYQGKLWQDLGKTVAATADGHPVRVAVCPFSGINYTAPSDAARPILRTDGSSCWWLAYDAVDDALAITVAIPQPYTLYASGKLGGINSTLFDGGQVSQATLVKSVALQMSALLAYNGGNIISPGIDTAHSVVAGTVFNGTSSLLDANGIETAGTLAAGVSLTGLMAGTRATETFKSCERLYGFMACTSALSAGERKSVRTYLKSLVPSIPLDRKDIVGHYDWTSPIWGELGRTTNPTADGAKVYWWDDYKGLKNLRVFDTHPLLNNRPSIGPSAGKRSLEWDGTTQRSIHYPIGTELFLGSAMTLVIVFKQPTFGGHPSSGLIGRGGYANSGTYLRVVGSSGLIDGTVTTSGGTTLTEPGPALPDTWRVAGLSYDGTLMHLGVRGKATQSAFKSGAMTTHPADIAFWVGAVTDNGSNVAWNPPKHIALAYVLSSGLSAVALEQLLEQTADYAGIP